MAIETQRGADQKETADLRNICSSKWGDWRISGTRPLSKESICVFLDLDQDAAVWEVLIHRTLSIKISTSSAGNGKISAQV